MATAWIAAAAAAIVAVMSAFLTYNTTKRLSRRSDQIAFVGRQLSELYGPLHALSASNTASWNEFLKLYRADRLYLFDRNTPPEDEVIHAWKYWLTRVFMPINRKMFDIILAKTDLVEGGEMPECFIEFSAHVTGYEVVLARWEDGDYSILTSVNAGGGSVTACTVQGMAGVRSGQARPAPWFLTGVSAEVSRIKRDLACTCTRHLPPVLVALRAGSRLRLEGRTRTLSGPSPDLSQPGLLHLLPRCEGLLFRRSMQRVQPVRRNPYPYGLTVSDRDYPRAVLPTGRGSHEIVREWLVASYVGGIAPDLRHVRKSG
jgi:hypothetical protein